MKKIKNGKRNLICSIYKYTLFSSCQVIAVILPVTSKGNIIDKNNPDPSQLLLMKYFYPSFVSTIEPAKYEYRVYLGYAYDDYFFSDSKFLSKLKNKMNNKRFYV